MRDIRWAGLAGEGPFNARRELASIQTILQDSSEDSCLQSLPPALSHSRTPGRVQTPPCSSIKKWCVHGEQESRLEQAGTGYTHIPRIAELRHTPAHHLARLQRLRQPWWADPSGASVYTSLPAAQLSQIRVGRTHHMHVESFELAQVLLALVGDVWCAWERGCAPVLTAVLRGSTCV